MLAHTTLTYGIPHRTQWRIETDCCKYPTCTLTRWCKKVVILVTVGYKKVNILLFKLCQMLTNFNTKLGSTYVIIITVKNPISQTSENRFSAQASIPWMIPGRKPPGTVHTWQWWSKIDCFRNATLYYQTGRHFHPESAGAVFAPPPGGQGLLQLEFLSRRDRDLHNEHCAKAGITRINLTIHNNIKVIRLLPESQ